MLYKNRWAKFGSQALAYQPGDQSTKWDVERKQKQKQKHPTQKSFWYTVAT